MNCEEIGSLFKSLPWSALDANQRTAIEAHAQNCDACTELMLTEKQLDTHLAQIPEASPAIDLSSAVMARIEQDRQKSNLLSELMSKAQKSDWAIWMSIPGFAITLFIYGYELFNGRSTAFNLFSLWTDGWSQWLFTPVQLNMVSLLIAVGFVTYLLGFMLMSDTQELETH